MGKWAHSNELQVDRVGLTMSNEWQVAIYLYLFSPPEHITSCPCLQFLNISHRQLTLDLSQKAKTPHWQAKGLEPAANQDWVSCSVRKHVLGK